MDKGNKKGFHAPTVIDAIRIAAGTKDLVHVQIFDAIVQEGSQNEDTMTCFVDSVDSTVSNLEVRYNLCISDGMVLVPADGSTVTIAKTAFTDPYIVKASDINSFDLVVNKTQIKLIDGVVSIRQNDITVTISDNKIGIKNGSQDFKTLMDSFFGHIQSMTFTNGAGTTGVANNLSDLINDKSNFDNLWQ